MSEAPDLNLDEGRPSSFTLRGEEFRVRHVSPSRYAEAVAVLDRAEAAILEPPKLVVNGDQPPETDAPPPTVEELPGAEGSSLGALWEAQLDFVEVSIHEDDVGRFRELRAREYDGIETRDLRKLREWLWEVHTGRPINRPEGSSSGPSDTAISSPVASPSPVVVRPT